MAQDQTDVGGVSKDKLSFSNRTSATWTHHGIFFMHGDKVDLPTDPVDSGEKGVFTFKKKGSIFGASGLLSYKMSDGNTIAFLFSVPYVHLMQKNKWNVHIYEGHQEMDEHVFEELHSGAAGGKPFEGNDAWHEKHLPFGYHVEGIMTSGNEGVNIDLTITK